MGLDLVAASGGEARATGAETAVRGWTIGRIPPVAGVLIAVYMPRATVLLDAGRMGYLLIAPGSVAHTTATRWAAVGLLLAFLGIARLQARTGRFLVVPRLALMALELAIMGRGFDAAHQSYLAPGLVVSFEAGLRLGSTGVAVPAAVLALGVACRSSDTASLLALLTVAPLAYLLALAVRGYGNRRQEALDRRDRIDREAIVRTSLLAGSNDVMVRGEPVSDLVQRAAILLELSGSPTSVRSRAADTKAALAESTRASGSYLGDVLLAWQRRHSTGSSLAKAVLLVPDPAARVAVLTPAQACSVDRELDRLQPAGRVPVRITGDVERIDHPRELWLGDRSATIPAASELRRSWTVSPLPAFVALFAAWMAQPAIEGTVTNAWVPVGFGLAGLVLAERSRVWIARSDEGARWIVGSMAAVYIPYAIAIAVTALPVQAPLQLQELPATAAGELLVIAVLIVPPQVSQLGLFGKLAAPIAVTLLSLFPAYGNFSPAGWISETMRIWLTTALMFDSGARFGRLSDERHEAVRRENARLADESFRAGREAALADMRLELDQLVDDFGGARATLDPELAAETARRIDEASSALRTIGAVGAP